MVSFLPDNNRSSCEAHHYGCGNVLLKREGNSVGRLVCLHLLETAHLSGYAVEDDGTNGCHVCFAVHKNDTGNNIWLLNGSLLRITEFSFLILPTGA